MTYKIQSETVVIHKSLQEIVRQKQICLHDVPNFLLRTSSYFFFLINNVQIETIDGYDKDHITKH